MREFDEFIDAYAVLAVSTDADTATLKAAHRLLLRAHHPDLVASAERADATRRMQTINRAYALLRDPQARAEYDRVRRVRLAGRAAARAAAGGANVRDRAASRQGDPRPAQGWQVLVRRAGRWAGRHLG